MNENKIKLIQRLSVFQMWSVWSSYWRLWFYIVKIKLMPPAWLKKEVSFSPKAQTTISTNSIIAKELHEAIRLAARLHFIKITCLPKSLVLVKMLKKLGLKANIYIGVAKSKESIASHAWVELDGQLIGEPEEMPTIFQAIEKC